MVDCGLQDLGFSGHPFTWSNGRQGEDQIQCRLDRAMVNESFISRFSPIKVSHPPWFGSDHSPLKIILEDHNQVAARKRIHLFRFEEGWANEPRCEDLVRRIWNNSNLHREGRLASFQSLDEEFKELRTNEVRKEIIRAETKLIILCGRRILTA